MKLPKNFLNKKVNCGFSYCDIFYRLDIELNPDEIKKINNLKDFITSVDDRINKYFDAEYGVCWDTIDINIREEYNKMMGY